MAEPADEHRNGLGAGRVPALEDPLASASRREFERRVLRASLIVASVVLITGVVVLLAWRLRVILLLIVVSLFLAALLHPIVGFFQRRGLRRGPATGLVLVIGVLIWSAVVAILLPPIVTASTHLVDRLPTLIRQAEHGKGQIGRLVTRFHLLKFVQSRQANLQSLIAKAGKPALSIGKSVLGGVVAAVTIFFLTMFLLLEMPAIVRGVLSRMQTERAARASKVLHDVGQSVTGYMLGNSLTSIIAGVTIGVTLWLVGVPYPQVLGVWVAIVDFLPLIGGLLAGVPTVIIAALHSLPAGIITLIVFLVYQQIENHLLNPVVMSHTVKLRPLYVLLAVLLGAEIGSLVGSVFGGVIGALLSVPAASAIQIIGRDLIAHRTGASLLGISPEAAVAGPVDGTGEAANGAAGGETPASVSTTVERRRRLTNWSAPKRKGGSL